MQTTVNELAREVLKEYIDDIFRNERTDLGVAMSLGFDDQDQAKKYLADFVSTVELKSSQEGINQSDLNGLNNIVLPDHAVIDVFLDGELQKDTKRVLFGVPAREFFPFSEDGEAFSSMNIRQQTVVAGTTPIPDRSQVTEINKKHLIHQLEELYKTERTVLEKLQLVKLYHDHIERDLAQNVDSSRVGAMTRTVYEKCFPRIDPLISVYEKFFAMPYLEDLKSAKDREESGVVVNDKTSSTKSFDDQLKFFASTFLLHLEQLEGHLVAYAQEEVYAEERMTEYLDLGTPYGKWFNKINLSVYAEARKTMAESAIDYRSGRASAHRRPPQLLTLLKEMIKNIPANHPTSAPFEKLIQRTHEICRAIERAGDKEEDKGLMFRLQDAVRAGNNVSHGGELIDSTKCYLTDFKIVVASTPKVLMLLNNSIVVLAIMDVNDDVAKNVNNMTPRKQSVRWKAPQNKQPSRKYQFETLFQMDRLHIVEKGDGMHD
ncbi:hypothetical protein HK101_008740 [Irineochytrium annulatum]|nr:hypothetical protein HK101_008740 [Irineochytrium annulatum]